MTKPTCDWSWNNIVSMTGLPIFTSPLIEQRIKIQNKKHRKKRINKKWSKRYGSRDEYVPGIMVFNKAGNKEIWCHPVLFDKLKQEISKSEVLAV